MDSSRSDLHQDFNGTDKSSAASAPTIQESGSNDDLSDPPTVHSDGTIQTIKEQLDKRELLKEYTECLDNYKFASDILRQTGTDAAAEYAKYHTIFEITFQSLQLEGDAFITAYERMKDVCSRASEKGLDLELPDDPARNNDQFTIDLNQEGSYMTLGYD